jgi:hypothetical protein
MPLVLQVTCFTFVKYHLIDNFKSLDKISLISHILISKMNEIFLVSKTCQVYQINLSELPARFESIIDKKVLASPGGQR